MRGPGNIWITSMYKHSWSPFLPKPISEIIQLQHQVLLIKIPSNAYKQKPHDTSWNDACYKEFNVGADPHRVLRMLEHPLNLYRTIYIYVEIKKHWYKINIEHPMNKWFDWSNGSRRVLKIVLELLDLNSNTNIYFSFLLYSR